MNRPEETFELEGLGVEFDATTLRLSVPRTVTDGHYAFLVEQLEEFLHGPYGDMDWEIDMFMLEEVHMLLAEALTSAAYTLRQRGRRFAIARMAPELLASDSGEALREFVHAG